MMYKQAMQVPVLLMIVGVTFMLCGQVSTSCSCSGYVTSKGRGECNTSYKGKKYCYVNPGQCSDQIKGSSSNRFWSYQACEKSSSPLPQVRKTQLLRALAEPVAQRTTPVGRERVTVTQTTRTPVSQVSGQDYNFNEDGSINCQTMEDCPPGYDVDYGARVLYSCGGYINDKWIEDICVDQTGRGITCGNGKRAKDCGDCGTTEEECGGGDCLFVKSNCVRVRVTEASVAYPLTQNSAIGGTGIRTLTAPDRYVACGPHYCRRGDKCCLLVNIGWSNSYLGCPQYC
eukprot:GFUD01126855.1.p1 GENE.GFUD01126855.1~~GFUD01126855.1.p1  ORF type:complete len:286 (-),score=40.61 GFUD01126855.1:11-868(-)